MISRILSRAFLSTQVQKSLEQEIKARIKLAGPLSISQFMQEVLTNPKKGYYTTKEKVLGTQGDFVTSPEISQMFGESIAIWIIHEWKKMGQVRPLNLVELGPGHGTLMQDILRTFAKLAPEEVKNLKVHLVETSQNLSKVQEMKLKSLRIPTDWYGRIGSVPKGFSFFIANEFFDALPIYKFVKNPDNPQKFQEVMINVDKNEELVLVRSREKTLANQYIDENYTNLDAIEISPKSGVVMEEISQRIVEFGGAALIADYGYFGKSEQKIRDTFRAFKDHKIVDPLKEVGQADLTADVDFDYLRRKSGDLTLTYGPVEQSQFLIQLGIQIRCNLLKDYNPDLSEELDKSLDYLINPEKMGSRFKFFCVFPKTMKEIHSEYPPIGFYKRKNVE